MAVVVGVMAVEEVAVVDTESQNVNMTKRQTASPRPASGLETSSPSSRPGRERGVANEPQNSARVSTEHRRTETAANMSHNTQDYATTKPPKT